MTRIAICRSVLIAGCVSLVFSFSPRAWAAEATTRPALSATDAAVLAQLQLPTWRTRQMAQAALENWADRDRDGAESAARAMLANATVPEARIRLRGVLDHIAADRLMQPTLITMHRTDAPAKAVYEELFRQAGAPLAAFHPDLLAKNTTRLTANAERMPFWDVVSLLDAQSHVQLMSAGDWSPILSVKSDWANLPRTTSGPFRFMAMSSLEFPNNRGSNASNAGQPFVLTFCCLSEPGRRVTAVSDRVTVQEAVDEHDNSLVPDKSSADGSTPGCWDLAAVLKHPAKNAGSRLVRFRGTAVITIETSSRRIEVPDVAHAGAWTLATGTVPVKLAGCFETPRLYSFGFSFDKDARILDEVDNGALRLVDAKGHQLAYAGTATLPDGTLVLQFSRDGAAGPVKLVWDHTTATRELQVPIIFSEVNLKSLPTGTISDEIDGSDCPLLPTDDIGGQ